MFNFLIPGRHAASTIDILVEIATLAVGLAIAAGLRFAFDA